MTRCNILKKRKNAAYRILCGFLAFTFFFSWVLPPGYAQAQMPPQAFLNLPAPGTMVPLSSGFMPAMVTGITVHPENPLAFDFIITTGDESLDGEAFQEESRKLIKYFLATLTVPNRELWVNLSPYEKDRIVPTSFGNTQMGRDMLAQDYILKQLTASLMYPEDDLGKKFWDRVYAKAQAKYGTTEIPMNTFNKIWIVPQDAVVYEHGNSAFVIRSRLKVMLEEDYAALQENLGARKYGLDAIGSDEAQMVSGVTSEVVREVLIPEIEKEVNEGETFANLRQIYNSVILATWYEQNLKGNLLGQLYVDRNKTRGVDNEDKDVNQKIYERYVEAFKKGVYNYIREDVDPQSHEVIPRKYFSGGTSMDVTVKTVESADVSGEYTKDINGIVSSPAKKVEVNLADIGSKAGPTGIEEAVARAEGQPQEARDEGSFDSAQDSLRSRRTKDTDVSSPIDGKMAMTDLSDSAFAGKVFLVRPDFNVPFENGKIANDTRIREALPTIRYAVERGARLVLMAHLGDPQKDIKKLAEDFMKAGEDPARVQEKAKEVVFRKRSLAPVAARLQDLLGDVVVHFKTGYQNTAQAWEFIEDMSPGSVLLLENVRFNTGEMTTDGDFAANLYPSGVAGYILDGFGVSHRNQTSVTGAPAHIPRIAGFLLEKEVKALGGALQNAETVVIGGSKVSSKIGVIRAFLANPKVKNIVIGGAMANAFLKAQHGNRFDFGKSKGLDDEDVAIAAELLKDPENNSKIVIPDDFLIASAFSADAEHNIVTLRELLSGSKRIPPDWMILDIGPRTAGIYAEVIHYSKSIIFNGPMGVFEFSFAAKGTNAVLQAMADSKAQTVIGGGDSINALEKSGISSDKFYISTGGGASLELLEGKELPGLAALSDKTIPPVGRPEVRPSIDDEDIGVEAPVAQITDFLKPGVGVTDALQKYWQAGGRGPVFLQEIVDGTKLKKEFVLSAINGVNGNSNSLFSVEPTGLNKRLDGQTQWVRFVPRFSAGEYRLPQQGLRPGASSPMAQGERGQILKEDWKYYSEKFKGYLSRLRGRGEGAKSDLIDFLNDVGTMMDEEMADFPVEARYPLLKAAALLGKPDRQVLLNIIEENRSKFKSDVGDAILMMFDLVPAGWLEKMAPQMQGRVIYTVSPENLLLAGGLGYVMQVHEKFMHELGARVVSIEPMYKYRKDMHGQLQAIDYETTFNITDKREIGQDSVDVGGYVTDVRYGKGRLPNGKEVILIEEVPRQAEALRYTNTVYDYDNFGNHSWEEFSAFFGKAVLKLIRTEEDLRKAEETGSWRPAIVWGNDSQAAGAMALIVQAKNRTRDDPTSVLRDVYPVFSTHTFGNRQNFGLDQIDRVLGQLLGLEKKYYSAAVRFNIIDMASLAIRLVDGAGGLVNMVSRKHKVVLDRDQFDPDAKTVAITNGDDLSRAWGLVEDMYKDVFNRELKDVDDLSWPEARGIIDEAVRRLNVSFADEGVSDLGLDPRKPIVSYAGRLVNVKVSPFRTFTERNIKRLVADGFNVVVFGRLQNYKESMDLADNYRRIEEWIEAQKEADPQATAAWGRFVFKGQYNDAQKQLMLIASNLIALDSDDETGTSEWTEVNGAIALSWILASPWRLRAPDSQKVILGEGILAEANEKGVNLVIPEVPQDVLLEEISVMRAKRYNRQAKDIIAEVEDAYYETIKSKLSEAKNNPEIFFAGAIQSAKIAKIVNGYNTAAAYLTQWGKNVDTQSKWRMEARQVSKNFVAGLNAEQKQQLLNGERNGIRNFVFHVPPIASISVHERVFESGKGLRSFRIIKNAIEAEVWDGTLGHLRNGDYVKYIDGLTKGLQGQEEVLTWLNGLVADNELSWYKKDLIFSEFVGTLINGLENRRGSEASSSPVATIDLTTRPVDIDSNQTVLINHFTAREKYAGVGLDEDLIGEKKDLEQAKQQITEFLEAGRNINVAIGEFPSMLYDGEDIGPAIDDDYDLRRFPDRYNGMIGMAVSRGILQPRKTADEPYQIIQAAIGDDPYLTKLSDLIRQVEPLRKKSFEQLKREYGDLWKGFGYSQDTTVEEFALSELRSLVKKIQGKKASKNERLIEESSFEELRIGFDDMLYDRGYKGEFNEEYFAGRELYTKIVEELSNKAELENAIKILFSGISVEQIRNVSIIYQPIQAIKYQEAVSAEFQALRRGYILKALAEVVGVKETELANLEIQVFTSSPLVEDILKGYLDSREGQAVLLEEIVQAAGVKKEQLLSKIRAINNDSQNPVLVEPAGLHTRLDNETLWVQVVRKPGRRESASLPRGRVYASSEALGGIDLNPELLDLQIKRDANFVPLPLPQQPIEHMHIEGFVPVIINITPVTDLPMLLGIADGEWPDHAAREDVSPLPMDVYRVSRKLQYLIQKNAVLSLTSLKIDIADLMKRGIGLVGTCRSKFAREYGVEESGV